MVLGSECVAVRRHCRLVPGIVLFVPVWVTRDAAGVKCRGRATPRPPDRCVHRPGCVRGSRAPTRAAQQRRRAWHDPCGPGWRPSRYPLPGGHRVETGLRATSQGPGGHRGWNAGTSPAPRPRPPTSGRRVPPTDSLDGRPMHAMPAGRQTATEARRPGCLACASDGAARPRPGPPARTRCAAGGRRPVSASPCLCGWGGPYASLSARDLATRWSTIAPAISMPATNCAWGK